MSKRRKDTQIEGNFRPKEELGVVVIRGPRGGRQLLWRTYRYISNENKPTYTVFTCANKRRGCGSRIFEYHVENSGIYGYCWIKNPQHKYKDCATHQSEYKKTKNGVIQKIRRKRKKKLSDEDSSPRNVESSKFFFNHQILKQPPPPSMRFVGGSPFPPPQSFKMEIINPHPIFPNVQFPSYPPSSVFNVNDYSLLGKPPPPPPPPQKDESHEKMFDEESNTLNEKDFGEVFEETDDISFPRDSPYPTPHPIITQSHQQENNNANNANSNNNSGGRIREFNFNIQGVHPSRIENFGSSIRLFLSYPINDVRLPNRNEIVLFMFDHQNKQVQLKNGGNNGNLITHVYPSNVGKEIGFVNSNVEIGVNLPFSSFPIHGSISVQILIQIRKESSHRESGLLDDDDDDEEGDEEDDEEQEILFQSQQMKQDVFFFDNPTIRKLRNRDSQQRRIKKRKRNQIELGGAHHHHSHPFIRRIGNGGMIMGNKGKENDLVPLGIGVGMFDVGFREKIVMVYPNCGRVEGNEFIEIFFTRNLYDPSNRDDRLNFFIDNKFSMSMKIMSLNNEEFDSRLRQEDPKKWNLVCQTAQFWALVRTPPRDEAGWVDIDMRNGRTNQCLYNMTQGYQYLKGTEPELIKNQKKTMQGLGKDLQDDNSSLSEENGDDFFGGGNSSGIGSNSGGYSSFMEEESMLDFEDDGGMGIFDDFIFASSLSSSSILKRIRSVPQYRCDEYGQNLLHFFCARGDKRIVKFLIEERRYDLTQRDHFGNTCLHYASVNGKGEIMQLLCNYSMQLKFQLWKIRNNFGEHYNQYRKRKFVILLGRLFKRRTIMNRVEVFLGDSMNQYISFVIQLYQQFMKFRYFHPGSCLIEEKEEEEKEEDEKKKEKRFKIFAAQRRMKMKKYEKENKNQQALEQEAFHRKDKLFKNKKTRNHHSRSSSIADEESLYYDEWERDDDGYEDEGDESEGDEDEDDENESEDDEISLETSHESGVCDNNGACNGENDHDDNENIDGKGMEEEEFEVHKIGRRYEKHDAINSDQRNNDFAGMIAKMITSSSVQSDHWEDLGTTPPILFNGTNNENDQQGRENLLSSLISSKPNGEDNDHLAPVKDEKGEDIGESHSKREKKEIKRKGGLAEEKKKTLEMMMNETEDKVKE